jgi:hypothetical protein
MSVPRKPIHEDISRGRGEMRHATAPSKGGPPVTAAGDTVRYHIQISQSPTFDTITLEDSIDVDTTYQATLDFSTQYNWRVKAVLGVSESPWSTSWNFTTGPAPITCGEFRRFTAQCLTGSRIRLNVVLRNTLHTGETVTVTIDGNPIVLVIGATGRAVLNVRSSLGSHEVVMTDPEGCFTPITVSCTGLFAGGETEATALAGDMGLDDEVSLVEELPQVTALLGSYPNPFNPRTTIAFDLAADEFVELRIYDLLGREVSTLVEDILPAGSHSRHWDGSNLSSGVYFYHFKAGQVSETRKLLLTK